MIKLETKQNNLKKEVGKRLILSVIIKLLMEQKGERLSTPPEDTNNKKQESSKTEENWLANEEEIASIKDKNLKDSVSSLSKFDPKILGSDFLLNRLNFLQNQIELKQIKDKAADQFLSKIYLTIEGLQKEGQAGPISNKELAEEMAKATRKSALGEIGYGLPSKEKIEEQRLFVRKILNKIESSSRNCHDLTISTLVFSLESSLEEMDINVRDEVEARLALHDSSELMKQANGWISRPEGMVGLNTGSAAEESTRRGHELDRKRMKFLFNDNEKEGLVGLNVPKAWDLMQKAVFNFKDILGKLNLKQESELLDDDKSKGKVPSNFFTISNSITKEKVKDYLIKQLGGNDAAKKSFELAEKLAIATLENSVFNTSVTGNDELAEIINLKTWRKGRSKTGRDRGPQIHEDVIDGFSTSWLRTVIAQKWDLKKIKEWDPKKMTKENYELITQGKGILSSKCIFESADNIAEGSNLYYSAVLLNKYKALKGLILDRAPKPGNIDKNFLQRAVDYFNKADKPGKDGKHGPADLRLYWILGVVDVALAKEDLEWDARSFNELKKATTMEELSPKAGSFLTQEDWNWIETKTNFARRSRKLRIYRITRESFKNVRF